MLKVISYIYMIKNIKNYPGKSPNNLLFWRCLKMFVEQHSFNN